MISNEMNTIRMKEFTFVALLKSCAKHKNLKRGINLHDEIIKKGFLEKSPYIATCLITMYAKCRMLPKAKEVIEMLPNRNVVSWNALIAGYAQEGQPCEALNTFEKMQCEGLSPDSVTFICTLKACGILRAIDKGKEVHDHIARSGLLGKNVPLGNALIDMYAKCGDLAKARQVLDDLPIRDVVSWNTLISGYAQKGQKALEAIKCYQKMRRDDLIPDGVTFICIMKACGSLGAIEMAVEVGKEIHDQIVKRGFLEKDVVVGTALVDMYARHGELVKAQRILKELLIRNVISWNALISGFARHGQCDEAFGSFRRMQSEGIFSDVVTFISILMACGCARDINKGKQIHDEVLSRGLLSNNTVLGNALVDMYVKCGFPAKAQRVLDELSMRDVITWSSVIAGYAQQGQGLEALNCFERMQSEGFSPNVVTFISTLKACGSVRAIVKGAKIHEDVTTRGLLEKDIVLGTAVVDMYAKCSRMVKARGVLENITTRTTATWNALIGGYAQLGQCHEALECLEEMQRDGLRPDVVTFISILKVCKSTGAIEKGIQIHEQVINSGLLMKHVMLGNALVDMYAKCGAPAKALQLLQELPTQDIVGWNALISGYAQQGQAKEALKCFEQMQEDKISPDDVTLSCVLSACGHSGLIEDAQIVLNTMIRKYNILPNLEHYTCMVVAFGYSGRFDKALSVIHAMPSSDYLVVWLALLGSCKKWGNVKVGRLAFDQSVQLDNTCTIAYAHMANIFVVSGMHKDAQRVEAMRMKYAC